MCAMFGFSLSIGLRYALTLKKITTNARLGYG